MITRYARTTNTVCWLKSITSITVPWAVEWVRAAPLSGTIDSRVRRSNIVALDGDAPLGPRARALVLRRLVDDEVCKPQHDQGGGGSNHPASSRCYDLSIKDVRWKRTVRIGGRCRSQMPLYRVDEFCGRRLNPSGPDVDPLRLAQEVLEGSG